MNHTYDWLMQDVETTWGTRSFQADALRELLQELEDIKELRRKDSEYIENLYELRDSSKGFVR